MTTEKKWNIGRTLIEWDSKKCTYESRKELNQKQMWKTTTQYFR